MFRHLQSLFIFIGLTALLTSCSDDFSFNGSTPGGPGGDAIDFIIDIQGARGRGVPDPKTAFADGDVIHVQGTFTLSDGTTENRYGALLLQNGQWVSIASPATLTWPTTAVSGQFTAYYVDNLTGDMQPDSKSDNYLLTQVTPTTSPLQATNSGVDYGYAVKLSFTNVCSYLTLTSLEQLVSNNFWIVRTVPNETGDDDSGNDDGDDGTGDDDAADGQTTPSIEFLDNFAVDPTFNNAFYLALSDDNELTFQFTSAPDESYDNLVYISAPTTMVENSDGSVSLQVSYFLEPGNYDNFAIVYPTVAPNVQSYLTYSYSEVPANPDGSPATPPDFAANVPYIIDLSRAPGITITVPPQEDVWDESDEYYDVDVPSFLYAVWAGTDYENSDGVKILEQTPTGTILLHNVDFQFFTDYDSLEGFTPLVNGGQTFDGNFHYIRNLGHPLFYENLGVIENLGIKTVTATVVSDEMTAEGRDKSRNGALVMWNRDTGSISEVRISDVNLTVQIKTDSDSETHNVGCVVGSNTGTIENVEISGAFSLTVEGYEDMEVSPEVNATVIIGGIVGQNTGGSGSGNLMNVTSTGTFSLSIVNTCNGDNGAFYVGGIVGSNSGDIDGVILSNITIDGTQSDGLVSYMGGMAGSMESSSEASLTSCIVSGTVSAGLSSPYGMLQSGSYTGGIAGVLMNVDVTDCRAAVAVHGSTQENASVLYATGGVFGRIRITPPGTAVINNLLQNIVAYGPELTGPTEYMGNFAGIVPTDMTWDDYKTGNITVRQFAGVANVGFSNN